MLDQVRHWLAGYPARSPFAVALALGIPVLSFLLGLALILGLPPDYFVRKRQRLLQSHPVLRLTVLVARNVAGLLTFALGFVMALPLVPGPGLLFMLVGVGLVDFPGKRSLELRLLRERHVLLSVNRIRARFGRKPLQTTQNDGRSVVDRKP